MALRLDEARPVAGPPMRAAQLLRVVRERREISARALSVQVGLSPSYVSKVESGECEPSFRVLSRIAVALGLNPFEVWTIVRLEAAA